MSSRETGASHSTFIIRDYASSAGATVSPEALRLGLPPISGCLCVLSDRRGWIYPPTPMVSGLCLWDSQASTLRVMGRVLGAFVQDGRPYFSIQKHRQWWFPRETRAWVPLCLHATPSPRESPGAGLRRWELELHYHSSADGGGGTDQTDDPCLPSSPRVCSVHPLHTRCLF